MSRIIVVGSGAAGVHFALTALEHGHEVTMLDVGGQRPDPVVPSASFDEMKSALPDPVAYFLGERGEGVVYPSTAASYYSHPPSKHYVFDTPPGFAVDAVAMKPRFSFARGGLAEAWTGGAYAFNRDDLGAFPIAYDDMRRHYALVAQRIGIGATLDDLERFIPFDESYRASLPMDPHSQWLSDRYHDRRDRLQRRYGFYLGRSRVATLAAPLDERRACGQLGRCLWGCPNDAIYSPQHTLRTCLAHARFRYIPDMLVDRFDYDEHGAITRMVATRLSTRESVTHTADIYALAAGALSSSKIVLDAVFQHSNELAVLPGLMDNLQIHVPFLTPRMIGTSIQTAAYQFHHLAFGISRPDPFDYVHGQITTLKSASIHPVVQSLPLDLRAAIDVFRALRPGLAVANVNLADRRRDASLVTLRRRAGATGETELVIRYAEDPDEGTRMRSALRSVKGALRALGCFVPPGMTRVLPRGTSVHYAGTMPMTASRIGYSSDATGRSHAFRNLFIVDGAGLPILPSKNHTFTLMANASRIAAGLSRE